MSKRGRFITAVENVQNLNHNKEEPQNLSYNKGEPQNLSYNKGQKQIFIFIMVDI